MGEGGGLLGSAELSIKRALQIATTAKCVLHLSEYEKAVGGMQSSARTDGGATSRVVGSLLSWLADPHPGVFVIATANDVRELAPEQIREGRFTPGIRGPANRGGPVRDLRSPPPQATPRS